jgi:hypothetical protein
MITNQKIRPFSEEPEYLSYIEDDGRPELALVDPRTREVTILTYGQEAQELFETLSLGEARVRTKAMQERALADLF